MDEVHVARVAREREVIAVWKERIECPQLVIVRIAVAGRGIDLNAEPRLPRSIGGCTQSIRPEAEVIVRLVNDLCAEKIMRNGKEVGLTLAGILIVVPYNLKQVLPEGAQVGTVDKFQGQEAAVVIVSMTTSKGTEAPRGTQFLFNPNRFNVAISRAQCLAIVVHGKELFEGAWTKIDDLHRLNLFAHAEAVAAVPSLRCQEAIEPFLCSKIGVFAHLDYHTWCDMYNG